MSIKTVYQYRIYCTTDSQWETVWAETAPTTCPTDTAHTVNAGSVSIVDSVSTHEHAIMEEETKTGGHFHTESLDMVITQSGVSSFDWQAPYPVNVLAIHFIAHADNTGDTVEMIADPDKNIGPIVSDVSAGATTVEVLPQVAAVLALGYHLCLDDGTNKDDVGRITDVNTDTNVITFETPTTNSFTAATPTYLILCVKMIHDFTIGHPGPYVIGEDKIGASYIPANTIVRVVYDNKSGPANKSMYPYIDYLA